MVEKGIRDGICHAIYQYAIANNKCINNYDKNKQSSCLKYWDLIIWMDGQCQKSYL